MVTRLLAVTAIVISVGAPALAQTAAPSQAPVIVAQGTSVVKAAPDQAWATVAVETRDAKAPEARRLAAVAMTAVMAALKTTGLPADAIRTIGFSLNPDYEYVSGRQRMRGFIVSNQVQVRIDDVTKVADVLDAAGGLSLPASSTMTVTNVRFDLKDRTALERSALQRAVEDATARARAMAAGANAALGRIVRIDEAGREFAKYETQPMPVMMARAGDAAVSTPVSPSEIEIRAAVILTIEIK